VTDYLTVSGEATRQSLTVPVFQPEPARVFAWVAPEAEGEGMALTNEILGVPGALEEIRVAIAELDRGEGVEGIEAIRALLARGE
jgi:hypothetical protein